MRTLASRSLFAAALVLGAAALTGCGDDSGLASIVPEDLGIDSADAGATDVGVDTAVDTAEDTGPDIAEDTSEDVDAADASDASGDVPEGPDVDLPSNVVRLDTIVATPIVQAGDTVIVTCQGLNADDEPVQLPDDATPNLLVEPEDGIDRRVGALDFVPTRVGDVAIACTVASLGLTDDTPANVEVLPGDPYTLVAELEDPLLVAGEFTRVFCSAFDEFGNVLEDVEMSVATDPFGDGVFIDDEFVTVERAGVYDVRCDLDGATEIVTAELEVVPGLPATASIGLVPDAPVYRIGEVVEVRYTVADEFGNPIRNAPVSFASLPTVPSFGEGRFRFDEEGVFTLTLIVGLPTASGSPIVVQTDVTVNSEGPRIACDTPGDGAFVNLTPGETIRFRGSVGDAFGAAAVQVNGMDADLSPDGTFEAMVPTRFGINFVDILAADSFGEENTRTCAFLVADRWSPEGTFLGDAVTLGMLQNAFDDRSRGGDLNSLADILYAVLNSPELRAQIHAALQGANPLYNECVTEVWGACILRVRVNHRDTELRGPNEVNLTLVNDGMRAVGTVRGIGIRLDIGGTFSTRGWVRISEMAVDLTLGMRLEGGRPRVTLRSLNGVRVGGIDTDFSGITGFILDLVFDLFLEGTARRLIEDQIRGFIVDNFNDVLDGVISGLDISSLGSNFAVPRLDGSGDINIGFGISFSSLTSNPTRALFGIGTRFTGDINHEGATLGAPLPPGATRFEPTGRRTIGAGIAIGLLNQVMHTLWRGGLFDASINGDRIGGGVPADSIAVLRTNLPPVVVGNADNSVSMMIGAVRAVIVIPGVFDAPLTLQFGAVASSGFDLLPGDVIRFRDVTVDELVFAPEDASLDPATRDVLEEFLLDLVQYVVDDSLNSALPALPIPDFEVPADLAEFGIPAGTRLGIVGPVIENTTTHFVVEGNFGAR